MNPLDKHNDLIVEAATILMQHAMTFEEQWDAVSIVADLSHEGMRRHHGYRYNGTEAKDIGLKEFDFIRTMAKLRVKMAEDEKRHWLKALVHVTRADMNFSVDFEYDDPKRWSLVIKDQNMNYHGDMLRPSKK